MNSLKNQLFVSDMDGTLLAPDSSIPKASVDSLNRMIDAGLNFTIATARNYDSAYPILKDIQFKIPVILFNGVYLTDFATGKNIALSNFLSRTVVDDLMETALNQGIEPFIYAYGDRHKVYYQNASNDGAQNYIHSLDGEGRLNYTKDYEFADDEEISGMLLIDVPQNLEPVYHAIKEKYGNQLNVYFAEDVAMPSFYWLQVFHSGANKGLMVKQLAARLDFPLPQVTVFGDYLNDLDMFRIAGKAIAMGNALPEVKEAAHEVIGKNSSQSVVRYLEGLGF